MNKVHSTHYMNKEITTENTVVWEKFDVKKFSSLVREDEN